MNIAGVAPGHSWSFVIGLAGGNYVRHNQRNYKVSQEGVSMNDDGDMRMTVSLCVEDVVIFERD